MYTLLSPLRLCLLFTLSLWRGAVKSVKVCLLNELLFGHHIFYESNEANKPKNRRRPVCESILVEMGLLF